MDHDKNILLSTPFPTIPMLGTNCWCNVILFYVGNKRRCIVSESNLSKADDVFTSFRSKLFSRTTFSTLQRTKRSALCSTMNVGKVSPRQPMTRHRSRCILRMSEGFQTAPVCPLDFVTVVMRQASFGKVLKTL